MSPVLTLKEFESLLDEQPFDWQLRLTYADWLEDQGDAFCETQRWMVAHEICPGRDARGRWRWWGASIGRKPAFRGATPVNIFEFMEPEGWSNVTRAAAWSRTDAERVLHNALVKASNAGNNSW